MTGRHEPSPSVDILFFMSSVGSGTGLIHAGRNCGYSDGHPCAAVDATSS